MAWESLNVMVEVRVKNIHWQFGLVQLVCTFTSTGETCR